MATVIKSPDAERDVLEIWVYVAERNFDAADDLVATFNEKLSLLAEFPGLGAEREDLHPGLRMFPVGNYLLLYRIIPGGIELVRVAHGARDLIRLFRRR
jgi:toxin ParE1/3/4